MKRLIKCLVLAALLLGLLPAAALAEGEHHTGGSNWKVTFTSDKKMSSTFDSNSLADTVRGVLPGDDLTLTVALKNDYSKTTDWYMSNEVLKTFEDDAASGGAYTYRLTYTDASGNPTVIYNSDTVGGDVSDGGRVGMTEATEAMEGYFYLGQIASGKGGSVELYILLDGETQGNAYMDTLAQLKMNFAVDVVDAEPKEEKKTVYRTVPSTATTSTSVSTGDGTDLRPLFWAMAGSGVVLAVLAADSVRRRAAERGDER